MNLAAIKEAEREAERFLGRIADLEDKLKAENSLAALYGSPESGAVRRASMDLTRSLSKLRARS